MIKTFELELDIFNQFLNDLFTVSNNDVDSIRLKITITEMEKRVNLTGKIIRLAVKKTDGDVFFQMGSVTNGLDGLCEVVLSREAYISAGRHEAELIAYEGDGSVAVKIKFNFLVNEVVLTDTKLKSKKELPDILEALVAGEAQKDVDINTILLESSTSALDAAQNANTKANFAQMKGDYANREAEKAKQRISELEGLDVVKLKGRQKHIHEQLVETARKLPPVSVSDFGTKGDWNGKVGTDDTQAILDAIRACIPLKEGGAIPTLLFPYCRGYKVTSNITVPAGISVVMEAPIIYAGTQNEVALTIGEAGINNKNLTLNLQVEKAIISDWTSEECVGIRLINTLESNIHIKKAKKFTIGVQFMGDGRGNAYNNVSLYSLNGNKFALDLTSKNAGWANENAFKGGRFSVSTGQNNGQSRYGIRFTSSDGYMQNNNIFLKPSFELQQPNAEPGEAIPVVIEYGSQNTFIGCRSEKNSDEFGRILNISTENNFHVGFGSQTTYINDNSMYPASKLEINRRITTERDGQAIYSVHNIQKNACYYDGATNVHVAGMFLGSSVNGNVLKSYNSYTINDDYLELGKARSIGVFVDTRTVKKFLIRREVLLGNEGRIAIRCYDIAGNILTNLGVKHPYVKSMVYRNFYYSPDYGGSYLTGIDTLTDHYINIHTDVAKIAILFVNGTNVCRIRGFSLYVLDGHHASVSCGYNEIISNVNLGTAPPTTGTWTKGKLVLNDNKKELGTEGNKYVIDGWECIASGSPGTWISKRMLTGN